MYFKSREAAGKLLASQLAKKHQHQPCVVIALSDGGVVVGMQIAAKLRCALMLLATEPITLPRENQALGAVAADGSYNNAYSKPDIDEMTTEYRNFIELEKLRRINDMHRASGEGDIIRRNLIEGKHIILVSDGLQDSIGLDLAFEFLKPVASKQIIVATPFASVPAVDRMHVLADEIFCLNVLEDYFTTDHYYDAPGIPAHEKIIATVERVVASWKDTPQAV
jgi:putative phosphoribosyl transferase